jgi:hypothetical protein
MGRVHGEDGIKRSSLLLGDDLGELVALRLELGEAETWGRSVRMMFSTKM